MNCSMKESLSLVIKKIQTWLKINIADKNFIIIASVIVGLMSGAAAVALKSSVHFIQINLEQNILVLTSNYLYLIYPIIGISLTVLYVKIFRKGKITKGLSTIIHSVSKNNSDLPKHKTYSHIITSALTVGFGGSAGLEAPIVITGSAIGSNVAKAMNINLKGRTLLLACGAASGIAAIFNSPIAGVIFAFEVLLAEFAVPAFIPLLISSATAAVVSKALYSGQLFFLITDGWEFKALPYYVALGFVCGIVSAYIIRVTLRLEAYFGSLKKTLPKLIIGSVFLGILIFLFPPLYGEGYKTISALLSGENAKIMDAAIFSSFNYNTGAIILFSAAIIFVKPIATSLTIGSGGNGGIFAPSLFIGAVLGFLYSLVINYSEIEAINQTNFVAVGMAGILSGVIHAPLTGIFLIAEVTGGYSLFVPLMIVSAISYFTSRYFEKYSIYTKTLAEKGIWTPGNKDQNVLNQITFFDLIEKDFIPIKPNYSLRQILKSASRSKRNIFPVIDDNEELLGLIMLDDLREVMLNFEIFDVIVASEMMRKPVATVEIDCDMSDVMKKFDYYKIWNIPVLEKGKYMGFLSKSAIFSKYRDMLIKQSSEIL